MEQKETTAIAAGDCFISKDKVALLNEIKDMCYFQNRILNKRFLSDVAKSAGCKTVNEIKERDFGTAYLTAKAILHRVGDAVFNPHTFNQYAFIQAYHNKQKTKGCV